MASIASAWLPSARRLSFGFVMLVVAGLVAMLVYGVAHKGTYAGIELAGKPAPDFTLELFDGGSVTLSDLAGKPVVINLWASWCGPCREEAPVLEAGWRKYRDQGVVFIGVDVQDTEEDARAFIKEFKITYLNGPDTTNRISVNYGLTGLPETIFVKPDGTITRKHVGALNERLLRNYLAEITR